MGRFALLFAERKVGLNKLVRLSVACFLSVGLCQADSSLVQTGVARISTALGIGPMPDNCKQFLVFDGTLYRNKPDMTKFGMLPANIIYAGQFWPGGRSKEDTPPRDRVVEIARAAAAKGELTVLDIEHWRLNTESQVRDNVPKYLSILGWFRAAAPDIPVGYFGMFPLADYERASMAQGVIRYRGWQADNDRVKVLADAVDVVFPEAYTLYADRAGWVRYAKAVIAEAKRYGKQAFVFLWPQYSEANRDLGHQYLPPDYWKLQLETAWRHADGIVIWGGWDARKRDVAEWDEGAPWWAITQQFLRIVQASQQTTTTQCKH